MGPPGADTVTRLRAATADWQGDPDGARTNAALRLVRPAGDRTAERPASQLVSGALLRISG